MPPRHYLWGISKHDARGPPCQVFALFAAVAQSYIIRFPHNSESFLLAAWSPQLIKLSWTISVSLCISRNLQTAFESRHMKVLLLVYYATGRVISCKSPNLGYHKNYPSPRPHCTLQVTPTCQKSTVNVKQNGHAFRTEFCTSRFWYYNHRAMGGGSKWPLANVCWGSIGGSKIFPWILLKMGMIYTQNPFFWLNMT